MPLHLFELVALGWAMAAPEGVLPVRIDFEAPAGCSSADAFYAAVRARTDRVRRAQAGERGLGLRVRLSREGANVHGELESLDDETETRVVDGATCDEVVEALSLTAALAIDPNARFDAKPLPPEERDASSRSGGETASKSGREAAPTPPPRPAKRRARAEPELEPPQDPERENAPPRPSAPYRVELGGQVLGARVLSSDLSLGGGMFLRLSQRGAALVNPSFGLALLHLRNDWFTTPERMSARWTGVAVSACPLRVGVGEALALTPCVLGMGGWLHAQGRNLSHPESADRSWWSAGGTLRLTAALGGQITLELEGGLTLPVVRRRFVTRVPDELVGQTPEIAPLGGLGLVYGL